MIRKMVLIGAGSAMFTRGLVRDLIESEPEIELGLVDIDPEALSVAEGLAKKMIESQKAPIKLSASTDRREILKQTDVVICTIGVGGRRAWEQDVFVPRKFGIYQPVGDTAMPGGLSRALRMVPSMVDIAKDILDLCPDAWFFNYGNPMTAVCRGVRKATGANIIGLCHGVMHAARYLAGCAGVDHTECNSTVVGVNHLTWFTEYRHQGKNLWPQLQKKLNDAITTAIDKSKLATEFAESGTMTEEKHRFADEPFAWEIFKLFGAFPAVMDRHITEFFPQFFADGRYYGKKLGVDAFSFEGTIEHGDTIFEKMKNIALSDDPLPKDFFDSIEGEHEQVIEIINCIEQDHDTTYSVNLPNRGQVSNLPDEVILETSTTVNNTGFHPWTFGDLPSALVGVISEKLHAVETIVDAAIKGDRNLFIQALILDRSIPSIEIAQKLADELLTAQKQYLPQFKT